MMNESRKKVLIVGAGEAGRMVADEIRSHPGLDAMVAGFLDDDPALSGEKIGEAIVLGNTAVLQDVVRNNGIGEIIIAVPTAPGKFVREMVRRCREAGVPYKIVPGVMEIIKGDVHIDQIREVRIDDLLGRETVSFDVDAARRHFAGKRVLVTGAGGSIGSELCRQIAEAGPEGLVLFGRGENSIFDIEEDLKAVDPDLDISMVIGNLTDAGKIERVLSEYSPHIVFHAAAHKHVHYMERDPSEAVTNNVKGSIGLIRACDRSGVERFVFISSDKAADPTGVMGATKRVIEIFLSEFEGADRCSYITVRFGNVIGSRGSVVPLFLRQIARGGPVTVSDAEATRFFMTVREAASLVIRSSIIGNGGEIFILDMGEPVNILEMARDIIMLTGHEPDAEIPIRITGLRDGEKLHEVLSSEKELLKPSEDDKIFSAIPSGKVPENITGKIDQLIEEAEKGDHDEVLLRLSAIIPGFSANKRPLS
ncbi:MAG: polysaccharide biosynthesis protein [Candidatus Krumholzibacteria bacterium]|nr:polysaccharide biosynthesis protein [Candidatus Krumholzibacteria bacterium]